DPTLIEYAWEELRETNKAVTAEELAEVPNIIKNPTKTCKEAAAFQIENDSFASHSCQEPSSPKMMRSVSLQIALSVHGSRQQDTSYNSQESPKAHGPPSEKMLENGMPSDAPEKVPSIKRQDSFEMLLPELPKIDHNSKLQLILIQNRPFHHF
ncbi:hypothetical protein EJ110_NYTH40134, partial [Nymphaea thermarum]